MDDTVRMDEEPLAPLLQVATMAADCWAIRNRHEFLTSADRTRGIVTTAVMHLVEQGLLIVPDDLEKRLEAPIPVHRKRF